jgi:transcriptional regulator with GAF, ATPase, and Fis domain
LAEIRRLVEDCGVEGRVAEPSDAVSELALEPGAGIGLVGLDGREDPVGLDVVRRLKPRGVVVMAYADGVRDWPLGTRCQVLLAGAARALDSKQRDFATELRRHLEPVLRAQTRRGQEEQEVQRVMAGLGMVGVSHAMRAVFRWAVRAGPLSDLPALITGETGTGKELLARALHRLDPKRRTGPFVAVNCGAISPSLAESELFGHRRGAYTGADQDRRGLIRSADGGVLFLDEIGELSAELQAKLLRVLQDSRVLSVGEDREVGVSVRFVAATNRDLEAMVERGAFRSDLFHRLRVLFARLPPIRERTEDVGVMVEHFLDKHASLNPRGPRSASAEFVEALARVDLPGNARQLENLVRCALLERDHDAPLDLNDLPAELWQLLSRQEEDPGAIHVRETDGPLVATSPPAGAACDIASHLAALLGATGWTLSQSLAHCERALVEAALELAHGNQSRTAKLLGITSRSVYNKLRKHRLGRP